VSAGVAPLTATAGAPTTAERVRRFATLTYTLGVTEWKLRFFGSALGYLWTLARPLLFFGVLYVVFTQVAKFGDAIKHYPAYLLAAIVLFSFFSEATGGAVQSLVDRESLLRKVRFPRMVVPLSVVLTSFFNLGMNFIAVTAFLLLNGIHPTWSWLEMPVIIALLAVFTSGVALLLSALFVQYRDVAPIWEVTSQALFYGSPIFYTVDFYGQFTEIMASTPIVAALTQMRHALIDPTAPSLAETLGSTALVLVPVGLCFLTFALGWRVFSRRAPMVAERL